MTQNCGPPYIKVFEGLYDLRGMNVIPGRLWESAIATDLHRRVGNNARGHYPLHLKSTQQ